MKVEFNPDGSIKVPESILKQKQEQETQFNEEAVIRIIRRPISTGPLVDELEILISPNVKDPERVESVYKRATGLFKHMAQLRISKKSEREYVILIESGQYRDSWIQNFKQYLENQMKVKIQYWGSSHDWRSGKL